LIVAVLAGGRGRRLGGSKPLAQFGGAPLIERPLAAAREAGLDAVVVAKADTPLLARLAHGGAVRAGGRIEPFPARYEPAWLPELRAALGREAPVRATLEALGPATIEWDAAALRIINTPEDLNA
jgi:molybdopterin-guanine dinucleotide biosynthesis protein A